MIPELKKYFSRRKLREDAEHVLRQTRHVRNMRGDLMSEEDMKGLLDGEIDVRRAMASGDNVYLARAVETLAISIGRVVPQVGSPGLRENLEIIAVAFAVAMGIRTYFIQPFKIPTGSMQPTLYGIHSVSLPNPGLTDRFVPLKALKWLVFGEWHKEVKVKNAGILVGPDQMSDPAAFIFAIGRDRYKIPRDACLRGELNFSPGRFIAKGAVLWSGVVTAGDHVFVDKVRWNFSKPSRGQVMVFATDAIPDLPKGTHYIKRMVGMPNESISITPPNIVIDGKAVTEPWPIARVAGARDGYAGYQLAERHPTQPALLTQPTESVDLGPGQYFCLGDNTLSSKDSRYWRHVPEDSVLGPAVLVYWPYSERWGRIH